MLRRFSQRRIIAFSLLDCVGSLLMLYLAAVVRSQTGSLPEPIRNFLLLLEIRYSAAWPVPDWRMVLPQQVFLLVALLWPAFFSVFSVYDGRRNGTLRAELASVLSALLASTMTLAGVLYFTYSGTPRVLFLIFLVLDACLLLGSRIAFWLYQQYFRGTRRASYSPVLVVGAGPVGQAVARQIRNFSGADLGLAGYVDDDPAKREQRFEGLPVLGTLDDIECIVSAKRVQHVVVALPLDAHDRLVEICRRLQKLAVRVYVIPDLFALSFPNAALDGFRGMPVIDLGQPSIHGWRRYVKRMFDVVVSVLILVITWPVLLLIAVLIKLDSGGPVIYRQKRIGENGRPFTMFKFRSMRADADPKIHQAYVTKLIQQNIGLSAVGVQAKGDCGGNGSANHTLKMEDDPRITRMGRILRKTSLDEIPQLLNVIRGDMSLVGPRPPIPYEVEVYQDWHRRRLEAIPGITGLWQVEGRNQVSFDEMVRLDLKYIERQSLWLDLRILLQTPLSVITGRGAG